MDNLNNVDVDYNAIQEEEYNNFMDNLVPDEEYLKDSAEYDTMLKEEKEKFEEDLSAFEELEDDIREA